MTRPSGDGIDPGRVLALVAAPALVADLSSRAVLSVNDACLSRIGFDRAEASDLDLVRLHGIADLERILVAASRCGAREGNVAAVACQMRDGGSFAADVRIVPLADPGSSLVLLVYAAAPAAADQAPADLSAFTAILAGVRTTDALGTVLAEAARGLMGTETGLLISRSSHTGAPEVVLSSGLGRDAGEAVAAWLGGLIGGGQLSLQTPRVVADLGREDALQPARTALLEAGWRSCVIFPLENGERIAGAWALGYADPARAAACDLDAGRAFAAHVAGSLAGALLLERTRREKDRHEVLNRIISWLRGPFDIAAILKSITAELCRALEADRCLILTTAGGAGEPDAEMRVQGEHAASGLAPLGLGATIRFGGTALGGAVLFSKEPLAVDDITLRPDLSEDHEALIESTALRGVILAKIVARQTVIGLVVVATSGRPRAWTRDEADLVRDVADHAGLTMETDRLASSSRERAEQIERERREWERTFDAIPDMLAIHDGYGRLLRANLALQVRLGADPRSFLGKECADLLASVVGAPEGCPHEIATQERRSITREIQGPGGSFALTAIPCFDGAGRCLYIIHVCKDVTEEKKIREQLMQSEKLAAVGGLVSGVAHELNNPLTGVVGYSELLLKTQSDAKVRKSLQRIHDEANRATRIVGNLLTFARKHRPERTAVDVNAVLERTLDLRAYELRVNRIKVVTDLAAGLPTTLADPHQLVQVFMNLIGNAEQAMQQAHGKGMLTITSRAQDGAIRVEFKDDGPGIAPRHLKKIFEPFFTTKPVGQGTGLGLSICHGILKEHGGSIDVASKTGEGTTFTLTLPVVAGTAAAPEPEKPLERTVAAGSVLVVDDEPFIRDLVNFLLSGRGHTVDTAENGGAALEKLKHRSYDLIVSDLRMPEMDGRELYARIRADHPDLVRRVLFISGDTVASDTQAFLVSAGRPFVLKPFKANELIREAESLLAATRPPAAATAGTGAGEGAAGTGDVSSN